MPIEEIRSQVGQLRVLHPRMDVLGTVMSVEDKAYREDYLLDIRWDDGTAFLNVGLSWCYQISLA